MPTGRLIVICHSGGKFTSASDGSLSYGGGEAHAISINREDKFQELKSEVAEMCNCDPALLTIKYFLPDNRQTLITISSDKDIQRMLDFHEDSKSLDVFVIKNDDLQVFQSQVSALPCSRSSGNMIDEPVTPINVAPVASVPLDMEHPNSLSTDVVDPGQQKLLISWSKSITGLHQQFNNVKELREALRRYCIALGFKCKFKHNDNARVSARCKAEGCPWRMHASRLSTTQLFRIKTMNETHTCGAGTSRVNRPNASRKMVATIAKEKLRDSPNFTPKEIAKQIQQEFGIELRYSQAWRGMETARQELQGSYKEAYNQLPWLRDKIIETNPGSVVTLATREDQTFHGFFVALHASIYGFQNGCRPLLLLDTMTLKTKYQSELLTATALDGNDGIFPVAFAVVDAVNGDNWHWFLVQLKSAISTFQPITFVADKQMGLRHSISMVFEDAYHSFCLDHLSEELKMGLKGPHTEEVARVIIAHLYDAALATTFEGFKKGMDSIKSISPEAFDWLMQSEPEHWANSLFEGSRYNQVTSGTGQSFYSWLNEHSVLPPVTQIIDIIRQRMMELIYTRKVDSDKWLTRLTPSSEEKLQKEILKAESLKVSLSPGTSFEVHDCLGDVNGVNIDAWSCSCRAWQLNGFPCYHGVVVLQHCNRNLYDYCSRYYATESYRLAYSEPINPVPTTDKPLQTSPVQVHPPPLRRLSGPPKQRRIRSKGVIKRPLHCSKCKGPGHNRATCHVYS
ncbi:uncharacterized protein LOC107260938 [Ricinus communis]|uniref:uncharacterized protein LOC107260938 n=1 Tax=Ricinus communis TaxID=3988 RepID=UPI000772CDE6|nr:uncharacterized protein LOC107260938 [Ricinus communis]|eukprot:XP_015572423.1 uncharacterized protein LOC107260938 [Ricinus communis]